jgi:hypothetical protein
MAFLKARYRLIFPLILLAIVPAGARAQTPNEYQVKAAFLFNFVKFVEWPQYAFKTSTEPITFCILGENPFGEALQATVTGKTFDGRTFAIRKFSELSPDNCHILFVPAAERKRFHSIADKLQASGLLTIGEAQWFIPDGGVINFKLEGGRVRLEINPDAAEQEQLHVSSKLLGLALIVRR